MCSYRWCRFLILKHALRKQRDMRGPNSQCSLSMLPKAPIANGTIGWLPDFFLLLVRGGAGGGDADGGNSTAVNFSIFPIISK